MRILRTALAALCCLLPISSLSSASRIGRTGALPFLLIDNGVVTTQTAPRPSGADPAFGGTLVGWNNGSITYVVKAESGRGYVAATGFSESYHQEPGKRVVCIKIEGQVRDTIDIVKAAGGFNRPYASVYPCRDVDGDGWIRVDVSADPGAADNNAVLNCLWVFRDADPHSIDPSALISGKLDSKAYVYAHAGNSRGSGKNRIESIGDGRLCVGNGYFLTAFVGPLENPESPVYKVHDKISRLWLGYSSPQLAPLSLAPRVENLRTGEKWTVGACDSYRFENGAIVMETRIAPGTVRTETYGLWEKPVFVRRISFTPADGRYSDYQVSTDLSLYADTAGRQKSPFPEWVTYGQDMRERPPALVFPRDEKISISRSQPTAGWSYDSPLYRGVAVGAGEDTARLEIVGKERASTAVFHGKDSGTLRMSRRCDAKSHSLTVVLAFDKGPDRAMKLLQGNRKATSLKSVQQMWNRWFESGAVVTTGNRKLDEACRVQTMYWKVAQDAELGGELVGGRYQMTVWARDAGVAVSGLLDSGHYDDARKALRFFSRYAVWNERNNCMQANTHASGRVLKFMCGPGQESVESILQPEEWTVQMAGPQLDGMAYYLYNIGKYYRFTNDLQFIREEWPFIVKVADALASDSYISAETSNGAGCADEHRRYRKYNPETGLIVDDCYESGTPREHMIMNATAVLGFRAAYDLSKAMGQQIPLWKQRSDQLDLAIRTHLTKTDGHSGTYYLEWVTRPWTNSGKESVLGVGSGYPWTVAATVPYMNYTNPVFKNTFRTCVPRDNKVGGWGMWFATLAQAAFEADLSDVGWHYLKGLLDQLPESLQIYELNQDVTGEDGVTRHVTLNLYSFGYMAPAVLRGIAGFGYDEHAHHYFFRPQVPDELGRANSRVRIGRTVFDVASTGNGDKVTEFRVDGIDQPLDGVLDARYLDGGRHTVTIRMARTQGAQPK